MPNKKQIQFKLVPKIHVYRNIADPKPRVEIVCAKQVVGLCVRQAMMTLGNVVACDTCTASDKLVAQGRPSKHEDMTVAVTWSNEWWLLGILLSRIHEESDSSHLGAVSVRRGEMTSELTRSAPLPKPNQTHGGLTVGIINMPRWLCLKLPDISVARWLVHSDLPRLV
ncbi:hypothetical protein F2Q70_00027867 [Brassica cretica]|uniref:Uncharacterized protein n=1 Tax=Brassica cretica TaxID=69181 RepID=A0A8S9LB22_BRACR|nr:hypothetical protein F2Q70_00027867 [Brassica cretica]